MGLFLCKTQRKKEKPQQIRVHVENIHLEEKEKIEQSQKQSFEIPPNKEEMSFVVYGEGMTQLQNLGNFHINDNEDLTIRISKQELLLLTEDNQDVLNFLKNYQPKEDNVKIKELTDKGVDLRA